MNPRQFFDVRNVAITLGKELGRGGEGAVYDVAGSPNEVAKIYLKRPGAQLSAKVAAMAGMANRRLLRIAAWPTATLHDPAGAIAGFLMPKVGGHKPIFQLYLPKPRLQLFPDADWRFLIQAATNTARAFATVHAAGLVIGDVNHGNLVVGEDATVQMIDCDSFQISQGGQTWFCTVGVGTHQPPEMQGRDSYAGILRTPNHDNFGLAVLIFQLLCMARHPFAGRFWGEGEPPSIEEAITASKYAYSRESSRTKMGPPPGSLPTGALPSELQDLFEQAFAPGAALGIRPMADRWVSALGRLANDLMSCRANSAHFYRNGLTTCPWCAIENASGITLFPVVFLPGTMGTGGIAALWQEVGRVPKPPALEPWQDLPLSGSSPSFQATRALKKGRRLIIGAWASVAVALAAIAFLASPKETAGILFATTLVSTLLIVLFTNNVPAPVWQRWRDVCQERETLCSSWVAPINGQNFSEIRDTLSKHKAEYDGLPIEQAKRLQRLQALNRTKQLEDHLVRFMIASATISGIGSTRVAALSVHGIDTAGDIVSARVLAIPDFGATSLAALLDWRQACESSFRFDPTRDVVQGDVARMERSIATRRTRLEGEIQTGVSRLKAASSAEAARVRSLNDRRTELCPRYQQALADFAVPRGRKTHLRLLAMSGLTTAIALMSADWRPISAGWSELVDPHRGIPASAVQLESKLSTISSDLGESNNGQLVRLYAEFPHSNSISKDGDCGRTWERQPRLVGRDRWTSSYGIEHEIVVGDARIELGYQRCSKILGIRQSSQYSSATKWEQEILTPVVIRLNGVFDRFRVERFRVNVSFVDGGSLGRVVLVENDNGRDGKLITSVSIVMAVDKNFKEVLQVPLALNIDRTCNGNIECLKRAASLNYKSKLDIRVGDDYKLHIDQTFTAADPITPSSWIIDKRGAVWQTAGTKVGTGASAIDRATR